MGPGRFRPGTSPRVIAKGATSTHIGTTDARYPGPVWTRKWQRTIKRIEDMSFKDLTARAAAALKPTPDETAKTPAKAEEPEAAAKETTPKSKTC